MTAQPPDPQLLSRLAVTPAWLEPDRTREGPERDEPDRWADRDEWDEQDRADDEWDDDNTDEGEYRRRFLPEFRWRSAPLAAVVLVVIGVLAAGYAAYAVLAGPVRDAADIPAVALPSRAGAASDITHASTAAPSELVVSVVGLVRRPGLVRVPPQSRIADAIARAGGAQQGADLLSLNLAAPLRDGDQILVGFRDRTSGMRSSVTSVGGAESGSAAGGSAPSAGAAGAGGGGKVNVNTASESELDALPGVGPVTAKAIIAWRQQHGKFGSVDQLGEVDGIGPARLATLRSRVTV